MRTTWLALGLTAGLAAIGPGIAGAQLQGKQVVIGVGAPLSGGAATFGVEMKQAVELAIEEANAAGGVLGATVAAEVANDEASAAKGEASAREFCDNPAVLAVVGHVNSGVTVAAS